MTWMSLRTCCIMSAYETQHLSILFLFCTWIEPRPCLGVILTFRRSHVPFCAFQLDCLRFKGPVYTSGKHWKSKYLLKNVKSRQTSAVDVAGTKCVLGHIENSFLIYLIDAILKCEWTLLWLKSCNIAFSELHFQLSPRWPRDGFSKWMLRITKHLTILNRCSTRILGKPQTPPPEVGLPFF